MNPVAGTIPWVPACCKALVWPIPAERLAAWRMAVGFVLLLDILLFYVPMARGQLYGPGSLGEKGVFASRYLSPQLNWSVLEVLPADSGVSVSLGVWIAAAGLLIIGWRPRAAALVAWAMSLSFYNTNFYLHNSGDRLRHFMLLLLVFAPTDAAWSIRRRPKFAADQVFVSGWPAKIMLIQMAVMYFMNGYYKMQGQMWWEGSVMWYVNHDQAWARWSPLGMPYWLSRGLTWVALIWEVGFPLWIMLKRTRVPALLFGVLFHVMTFFQLEIAAFPLYALCLYVPLAPWERVRSRSSPTSG